MSFDKNIHESKCWKAFKMFFQPYIELLLLLHEQIILRSSDDESISFANTHIKYSLLPRRSGMNEHLRFQGSYQLKCKKTNFN